MKKYKDERKPRTRFSTRVYGWLFIFMAILGIFMMFLNTFESTDHTLNFIIGGIAIALSIFFGMVVFIRFIRTRSITGGLFLTTIISSAVFLGTSQIVPVLVPEAAMALAEPGGGGGQVGGFAMLIALAQIGLFALWFGFLLLSIFLYIQPVKKIDKYLDKIIEGDQPKKVRIGKSKQYRSIERKISVISQDFKRARKDKTKK